MKNPFRGFHTFACLLALAPLLFNSGCSFAGRMSTMDPAGPIARMQLDLFMVTVYVTGFIFIVVGGTLAFVVLRYREKPGDTRPMPSQGHGNPLVEVGLIASSIFLLVIIAIPTLRGIWMQHSLPEDESHELAAWFPGEVGGDDAGDILKIRVGGWQWWWSFDYPQFGVTTANELVIPAAKAVYLELRSVDVIHSFWLPRIAGKTDLIPGRTNSMWIQVGDSFEDWAADPARASLPEDAQRAQYARYIREQILGHYYGQCAEYCGDSHARMLFRAEVVDDAAFAGWIEAQKRGHPAPEGRSWEDWYAAYDSEPGQLRGDVNEGLKLFMGRGRCATCHTVNGNPRAIGVAGPDLTRVAARYSIAAGWLDHRNEDGTIDRQRQLDNFSNWILHADEIKPGNLMWEAAGGGIGELDEPLTAEEAAQLAAYLQTLE